MVVKPPVNLAILRSVLSFQPSTPRRWTRRSCLPIEIMDQGENPYYSHLPQLSQLEADVLWEYAKLAKVLKVVRSLLSLGTRGSKLIET
jgi:hypothetical protein